jgi:hypothetical protein
MISEVRLIIGTKEARLMLKKSDDALEDELWTFDRKMSSTEAQQLCRVLFDEAFDLMNYSVHGDS